MKKRAKETKDISKFEALIPMSGNSLQLPVALNDEIIASYAPFRCLYK